MARMSAERLARAREQEKSISPEDYEKVKGLAGIVRPCAASSSARPTNTA